MTDQLHLLSKHRGILQDLLRQHLPDVEVWAYGSRVNGRSHDGSDLDLVLRGPALKEIPADQLGAFDEAVEESNIPFLVDARDWATFPKRFQREIERRYVVVALKNDPGVEPEKLFDSLPDGWQQTTLGTAVEQGGGQIQTGPFGSQLHASDYVPVGIPSIMPQNIGDNWINTEGIARITPEDANRLKRYSVQQGDIVYSRRGDVERRALIRANEDGWLCGTGCLRVRFGPNGVDPEYASYFLGHPRVREWIVRHAHGATMQNLNTFILSSCPFVVPSKKEQGAIAHILGTLDDKIELNRRMNETLEAMARALFRSWFVDFDPVRANVNGRDIGLSRDIAALFPTCLVDSEIGVMPEGWTAKALEEVVEINPSRRLRKAEIAPYLDMANMPTKDHSPKGWIDRPFGSGVRFVNGDTLLARITPCLENGKTAYVDFLEADQVGWGSTEYIVLRPKSPLPSEFGYFLARSSGFREFAIQCMTGSSGRQRVPAQAVSQYRLVVPPESVAENFGRLVRPLVRRASDAVRETRVLSALRDTLLPKLISGEVRVNQMERATA